MSSLCGIAVGFCFSRFCEFLKTVFLENDQFQLASEAKVVGRCLVALPVVFIGIMIYLIISVRGGVSALMSIGDLVLVKYFPLVMMIGAAFPAILIVRALMIFYRREEKMTELIVALDVSTLAEAEKAVDRLGGKISWFKAVSSFLLQKALQ